MAVRIPEQEPIQEVDDLWIPLPDGGRLSAHLWLPAEAGTAPVPAVVEISPYRHEDNTRRRDAVRHPYFAEHGYASLRVDIRGSGASSGVLVDEYTEQEQQDVCAALAWVAAQPWCTGSLGMIGLSWGGFAALQAAARRPAGLEAVVAVCASADRYGADVKYRGGCVLGCELLPWSSTMLAMSVRPPDPELAGEGWRELWLERLENAMPFAETWLAHQRRDDYWRCGSPAEDYGAIACPVYAVGGWADPYRQAVLDLLAALPGPRKGLIGPWGHRYPEEGTPGPAFDFRGECVRWWDRWLRGVENGVTDEPMLHAWMPASAGGSGRWVAEERWPPLRPAAGGYSLGVGTLEPGDAPERGLEVSSPESTGLDAGAWCPWEDSDLAGDQTFDDERSLLFMSGPLESPVEILGAPSLTVEIEADRPCAHLAVRLCDVSPDGASTLVTRGLLNLSHRDGSKAPSALEPGRRERVTIPLEAIAYAFPRGHRIRVAVSSAYWPWAWPSPERARVVLFTGASSRFELPVRPHGRDAAPAGLQPLHGGHAVHGSSARRLVRHRRRGRWTLEVERIRPRRRIAPGEVEIAGDQLDVFEIEDGYPLSARVECSRRMEIARNGWSARVETASMMTADARSFLLVHRLEAYENEELVWSRARERRFPRDLV
ncbi:MAG TPA: CocE/NonD family hydrolase [Gaiellaceae bacterium]|nr:CocE/NonD family hydrolase [Gaiellaceae bacterium]